MAVTKLYKICEDSIDGCHPHNDFIGTFQEGIKKIQELEREWRINNNGIVEVWYHLVEVK